MSSETERTARINEAFFLIERTARGYARNLPPGISLDDLVSLGGLELVKAADKYATTDGTRPWLGFVTQWLKLSFKSYLGTVRKKASRSRPLDIELPDGETMPRPDTRAKNPSDQAAARESRNLGHKALANAAHGAALPPPGEVAIKATEYRDALCAAVPPSDLGGLLRAMLEQGKAGNVAAAKLVFSVLQPSGPPPLPPPITVRVVLPGDDECDE